MTFPKARAIVAGCLFLAWIGFLFFLVISSTAIVLPPHQFRTAPLYIVAELREERGKPNPSVKVEEVIWSADPADKSLAGTSLQLSELAAYNEEKKDAKPGLADFRKEIGFEKPGKYILPLQKRVLAGEAEYQIAPIPRPPRGYPMLPTMLASVTLRGVWLPPGAHARAITTAAAPLGDGPLFAAAVMIHSTSQREARVKKCLIEVLAWQEKEADALLASMKKQPGSQVVVSRPVAISKAIKYQEQLHTAGGIVGDLYGEEVRIYPLRSETRAQIDKMIKEKQRLSVP